MKNIILLLLLSCTIYSQSLDTLPKSLEIKTPAIDIPQTPRECVLVIEVSSGWRDKAEYNNRRFFGTFKINPEISLGTNKFRISSNFGFCDFNPDPDYIVGVRADYQLYGSTAEAIRPLEIRPGVSYSYLLNENVSLLGLDIKFEFADYVGLTLRFNKVFRGSEYIIESALTYNIGLSNEEEESSK